MRLSRNLLLLFVGWGVSSATTLAQELLSYRVFTNADSMMFVSEVKLGETLGVPIGPETCTLADCQKWIKANWTDMRPLSLKKHMDADSLSVVDTKLSIVVNHEEQYSLKLAGDKTPSGWKEVGKTCTLSDCMTYLSSTWTDMRPLSQRKQLGKTK